MRCGLGSSQTRTLAGPLSTLRVPSPHSNLTLPSRFLFVLKQRSVAGVQWGPLSDIFQGGGDKKARSCVHTDRVILQENALRHSSSGKNARQETDHPSL
jgi:hypothetical protein